MWRKIPMRWSIYCSSGECEVSICLYEPFCKGCGICVALCPKNTLEMSERRNAKGAFVVEQTMPQNCVNCGTCQDVCPDFAIFVCAD